MFGISSFALIVYAGLGIRLTPTSELIWADQCIEVSGWSDHSTDSIWTPDIAEESSWVDQPVNHIMTEECQ
ncbi:MAG: hypothetical protein DRP85_03300 [Candidatus Makaraimicrobium thalassicum]|nr:MAG: hypothetical protein DRP85_03300 [Candidatus Omnitrophota bacterium]